MDVRGVVVVVLCVWLFLQYLFFRRVSLPGENSDPCNLFFDQSNSVRERSPSTLWKSRKSGIPDEACLPPLPATRYHFNRSLGSTFPITLVDFRRNLSTHVVRFPRRRYLMVRFFFERITALKRDSSQGASTRSRAIGLLSFTAMYWICESVISLLIKKL